MAHPLIKPSPWGTPMLKTEWAEALGAISQLVLLVAFHISHHHHLKTVKVGLRGTECWHYLQGGMLRTRTTFLLSPIILDEAIFLCVFEPPCGLSGLGFRFCHLRTSAIFICISCLGLWVQKTLLHFLNSLPLCYTACLSKDAQRTVPVQQVTSAHTTIVAMSETDLCIINVDNPILIVVLEPCTGPYCEVEISYI